MRQRGHPKMAKPMAPRVSPRADLPREECKGWSIESRGLEEKRRRQGERVARGEGEGGWRQRTKVGEGHAEEFHTPQAQIVRESQGWIRCRQELEMRLKQARVRVRRTAPEERMETARSRLEKLAPEARGGVEPAAAWMHPAGVP